MSARLAVALPAAAAAAGLFASSSVLQQRAARAAPAEESLSWRLIVDLVHRGTWLAGMGCVAGGYVAQALALAFAPVALVEPVVCLELVLALPIAARLGHRRLGPREWAGAAAVVIGVGSFIALCQAAGGDPEPPLAIWAEIGVPTLAASGLALLAARGPEGPKRASLLAVSAGLLWALLALVTQSLVHVLGNAGLAGVFSTWQVYALALIGPIGILIGQSAFQAGPLAMSLPILDSIEPAIAVVLAAVGFGQHVSLVPLRLAGEITGAALTVFGIFLLGRSPLVLSVYEQTERAKRAKGTVGSGTRHAA